MCVTCVWAGVDSVREQEKLEATLREMLKNAARAQRSPTRQVHPIKMAGHHFSQKNMFPCPEDALLGGLLLRKTHWLKEIATTNTTKFLHKTYSCQ